MPTFHSVLANTARILYCTRVPHGWEYDRLARLARFFHWVQLVFEALDVINLVTDGIFVVNLFFTNEIQALTLLIGMILARGCSQKGHSLSFHGGLYWAPFFCADPADSITLNAERESALFLLYGLVFAELCVFFFEDSTLILIYYWNSEALHQLNDFDRFNIWLTLLSVTATSLLLGACILGSINLVWCRGRSWIYKQQQLGFRDKLCVVMSCLTAWVLRLLRAGLFLLFLSFVGLCLFFACGAASSILIFGYQYNTSEPDVFLIAVARNWIVAAYFAIKLYRQAKHPDDLNGPICDLEALPEVVQTRDKENAGCDQESPALSNGDYEMPSDPYPNS